ncbi:DnaA [Sulfitobacter phage phiGT1]|nr:DnaA [Sulfitobacter phage phiGT1]
MSRIATIQAEICRRHDMTREQLIGKRRFGEFVKARFLAISIANDLLDKPTYSMLGRAFGGRDHTTIGNSISSVDEWRRDPEFDKTYHELRSSIEARSTPMFRHRDFTTCRKGAAQ